ncbi:unnamed protein product [marine sediment metagenome]|uniref:Uncharacterized protein n=1 Tax=marine sediment metagenome TaxID=412755 RepID=X1T2Z0_9ZZZZ
MGKIAEQAKDEGLEMAYKIINETEKEPERRIIVFQLSEECDDGRHMIGAIPEDKITFIKTISGGENVCCYINEYETNKASFNDLINILGKKINLK